MSRPEGTSSATNAALPERGPETDNDIGPPPEAEANPEARAAPNGVVVDQAVQAAEESSDETSSDDGDHPPTEVQTEAGVAAAADVAAAGVAAAADGTADGAGLLRPPGQQSVGPGGVGDASGSSLLLSASSVYSGIASVELMDVVTTGKPKVPVDLLPTRSGVLEGQSTISFEVVQDVQVAHPAFRQIEPGTASRMASSLSPGLAFPPGIASLFNFAGAAVDGRATPEPSVVPSSTHAPEVPDVPEALTPALSTPPPEDTTPSECPSTPCQAVSPQSSDMQEVKAPTSDRKLSVFIPTTQTPTQQQVAADDDEDLSLPMAPLGRPSPKSLLSPSSRTSPRRGLSRALSACLQESFKKRLTQDSVVPGPGVATPRSLLSPNASDIDWKLWWDERLQQLDQRVRLERAHAEAKMMRECLSMTAYSLGAQLLPHSLGLQQTRSAVSIVADPTVVPAKRESSTATSGVSRPTLASHRPAGDAASLSRASRRVSFSDFGYSLSAQPPSSAHSKPRRPGDKRPVVLEEPSSYLRFLRRSDKANFKPAWRPQLDDELTDTAADQVVAGLCQWMQQLSTPEEQEPRTSLTCDDVRKLFDINLEGPAARALAVNVKELVCVPNTMAVDTHAPQQSNMARVRQAVRSDLRAEERPRSTHAFGRSIPIGDPAHWRPPRNHTKDRWRLDFVPTELATMEEIFGGDITQLKVTRDFVEYLRLKKAPLPPCLRGPRGGLLRRMHHAATPGTTPATPTTPGTPTIVTS